MRFTASETDMKLTITTYIFILAFLFVFVATARTQSFNPFAKTSEDTLHILVLGSSTAAGAGASPRDSAWVNRYSSYLTKNHAPARVTNLARGGYTSYHLQEDSFVPPNGRPQPDTSRNISAALAQKPSAIIINLPSNDAASNFTLEEQKDNFERMAAAAAAAKVPVWFSTTQPRNFSEAQRANAMAMRDWILLRFEEKAIDFWTSIAMQDGTIDPQFNSGDGVHLNNAGHWHLFEQVVMRDIPGVLSTTIAQNGGTQPAIFSIDSYPNPFVNSTTFLLSLSRSGMAEITLMDMLGSTHTTVFNGYLHQGSHNINANLSSLKAGIYIYEIHYGKSSRYGKLIKIPG
jgi:lysophospholipase L1-like esterase